MKNPLNTAFKIHFGMERAKIIAVRILAIAALVYLIIKTF